MSAADEAARLREQAELLDAEAKLEAKLADAKSAYRDNRDDDKVKARFAKAKADLVSARRERREASGADGVTIVGDAFISNGNEG